MNKEGNFIEIFPEAHNNLVTKVLELENKIEMLTKQVSDLTIAVGRLEGKFIMFLQVRRDTIDSEIGAFTNIEKRLKALEEKLPVDVVSWKDFRDFLDDNAEDFDNIGARFNALEERVNTIEEKIEGYVFE